MFVAIAGARARSEAPAASTGDGSRRTASAHAVTAELRALAPDQLQGATYEQLLEARDVEDVLFGRCLPVAGIPHLQTLVPATW